MKKIRAAVIGCGNVSVMHLEPIKALDEAELVGVCDLKSEKAQAAAEKYNTTNRPVLPCRFGRGAASDQRQRSLEDTENNM